MLGPLRLVVGGEDVEVPGPKRRALLALLAVADGRLVPIGELLDSLWAGELPVSARPTLRSHASRLRHHLGPCASRLEGTAGGYRLRVGGEGTTTDVAEVRSLLGRARRAPPPAAHELLARARSLWRGPPLHEFDEVDRLCFLAVSLEELRCSVDQAFTSAAIEVGRPAEAVATASALVRDTPLSEPATLLLVRSLDAAGRPADALRVAYEHRKALREETGLEPSPALSNVEQAIAGRTPARTGRVPRSPNSLRGRAHELATLQRLVRSERLVTVTGPAGVGKTRLAVEVARKEVEPVCLWLTPLADDAAVPHALATALDLREIHGDPVGACSALLGAGPRLILIDSCEHLLAEVRDVVIELLTACPQLTILATSRRALGLVDEQQLRLHPLEWTSDEPFAGAGPAAAVFVDRVRRIRPGFTPSRRELAVICEIVERLDGLPLAIELAASRSSSLGLNDLRERLDRCLDLLGSDLPGTLRETLEWSYDLLDENARRLLRHLSVFPNGFDLAAAEAIADGIRLPGDGAATLSDLVEASMVEVAQGPVRRYRMLETIRTFARDLLVDAGEEANPAAQLPAWFHQLLRAGDAS